VNNVSVGEVQQWQWHPVSDVALRYTEPEDRMPIVSKLHQKVAQKCVYQNKTLGRHNNEACPF